MKSCFRTFLRLAGTNPLVRLTQRLSIPLRVELQLDCRGGESLPDTPSEAVARVLVAWLSWDVEIFMLDHFHATGLPGFAIIVKLSHGRFRIIIN